MAAEQININDQIDDDVDNEIRICLSLERPTSFFLFAGAGSGKTRSLITALKHVRETAGAYLQLHGKRVGVITYTNAACEEIISRVEFDPLVDVKTIHSFVWSLIEGFDNDIKEWLREKLESDIAEMDLKQSKARKKEGKTYLKRKEDIEAKRRRLEILPSVKRFTYSATGGNKGKDSLNHGEVIQVAAFFIKNKPSMQDILVGKYPILLIDESQDTNKRLVEAFLVVQQRHRDRFVLGLIGDTMQRIYNDGDANLGLNLPDGWAKPAKKMNHRCPKRIVELINKIRAAVDTQEQQARSDKEAGIVRLFLVQDNARDKAALESDVARKMAEISGDPLWHGDGADVKRLILEHHMAAARMGFLDMFEPLYRQDRYKTPLRDGTLSEVCLFSERVLPLLEAKRNGDEFTAMSVLREYSPLLSKEAFKNAGDDQLTQLGTAREAVKCLLNLWHDGASPTFLAVLREVAKSGLFEIPGELRSIVAREQMHGLVSEIFSEIQLDETLDSTEPSDEDPWDQFLSVPFSQIEPYAKYVQGMAPFDTHQGVKGREFPRVQVIIDDKEARGVIFSYERLFGVNGEADPNDVTRRLFYVTCSRAMKSLAVVAYTADPAKVRMHVVNEGWFNETEVVLLA
ncbi:UvrD-helicase domain-containing protein [Azospirillum sp. TSO5]|uniref:UvrD-helicase domain-containing protein n=1 Tax=Azospirillum sp. TSO5 TaxID=716760 RepID=UPI000D650725|nr:UvrD-helicase domain-containing protein [Azospirillum sp. TSO5]